MLFDGFYHRLRLLKGQSLKNPSSTSPGRQAKQELEAAAEWRGSRHRGRLKNLIISLSARSCMSWAWSGFLNISKAAASSIYPNATEDMSFCWGGTTKRTAAQALLRSIRAVLGAVYYHHEKPPFGSEYFWFTFGKESWRVANPRIGVPRCSNICCKGWILLPQFYSEVWIMS